MPDVRCPRCGEPWDLDSLHDVYIDTPKGGRLKVSFQKAWRLFKEKGCEVFATRHSEPPCADAETLLGTQVLHELAGDDADGCIED